MRFERDLFSVGGSPAAASLLYDGGGGRGLSDAADAGAEDAADALRHGGGHHAGGQRMEPAFAGH